MSGWLICQTCHGEGKHSLALGAITEDYRIDWTAEEMGDYLSGGYDQPCRPCKGTGKVTAAQQREIDDLESDPAWQSERWLREIGA